MDAVLKIWAEHKSKQSILRRIGGYYTGVSFYGVTYILYVALEFSFFEAVLHQIEQSNIFGPFTYKKKKEPLNVEERERHSFLSITTAAFIGGATAAILTNALESLAVNK